MDSYFSIDSTTPNAYEKIRDYLYKELKPILEANRPVVFLCIGSDRSTGDSLGPLVGYKLRYLKRKNIYIYGSLLSPVHSKNLNTILENIYDNFNDPYIVGIDACLGRFQNIGKVFIEKKPLHPGLAMNKDLPAVGNMSITGIVNIAGGFEFMILQNTRLYTVMALADSISNGIYHFILKSTGNNSSKNYCDDIITFPNV
ncbi:MAG: spore protease YyaC [Clostridium sp.]|nr:spore protease YyaC [Clostridium sp.]